MTTRNHYLKKVIARKDNGLIKVITGIRRCGKSYLLFRLYYDYLLTQGVRDEHIIGLSLDDAANARYRNPLELDKYIRERVSDTSRRYYVFLDEIQFVKPVKNPWLDDADETIGFVDVMLSLMKLPNVDLYVTGSNSKMLSSDIVTQFRDKGDEIRLYPFSYSEFCRAKDGDSEDAWREFYTYGGLPRVATFPERKDKTDYLENLFENTYLKDVLERHQIKNEKSVLDDTIRIVASSVGSLTNPKKIADTFQSVYKTTINSTTIGTYLDYFAEAFVLSETNRYDVKGRRYIGTPQKYYFTDVGLRNALLNFRQQEENHIMENIIYNELTLRGYNVDVGTVETRGRDKNGKDVRSQLEIDFIAKNGDEQMYVQSALSIDDEKKREQEIASLKKVQDSFRKIVVVGRPIEPWTDDNGIRYVGVREFLSGGYAGMEKV